MTRADLEAREAEDWFDPAGFLLAERDGELQGLPLDEGAPSTSIRRSARCTCWASPRRPRAPASASALLDAGLAHLRAAGLGVTVLYVDDDNPGAVALYERAGFVRDHRDTRYRVRHVSAV